MVESRIYSCPQSQECGPSISVGLFRNHNHACVHLELLSGNEYQTLGHLCTVGSQFCRCANQTDCAKRMVSITGCIQNTEFGLWPARHRLACIPPKQEGGSLLQMVPRRQFIRSEFTGLKFFRVKQPIHLPAMEPDLPSISKSPKRTINNNSGVTNMEICYLVSGPIGRVNLAAGPYASNKHYTESKKWNFVALGKQELALDGL
ncbi:hypothetical protein AYI70_g3820 [Smittium culicis]|uniref:Uncharacterized protein n=1 Tax=Smittium culicis TaxID=133412 RepID=A0A1R1Y1R0_9FUNG|nr:hypothetical protein AYI70_g3820 [Smittium culicis]